MFQRRGQVTGAGTLENKSCQCQDTQDTPGVLTETLNLTNTIDTPGTQPRNNTPTSALLDPVQRTLPATSPRAASLSPMWAQLLKQLPPIFASSSGAP